jgi:hypothetical protein
MIVPRGFRLGSNNAKTDGNKILGSLLPIRGRTTKQAIYRKRLPGGETEDPAN